MKTRSVSKLYIQRFQGSECVKLLSLKRSLLWNNFGRVKGDKCFPILPFAMSISSLCAHSFTTPKWVILREI